MKEAAFIERQPKPQSTQIKPQEQKKTKRKNSLVQKKENNKTVASTLITNQFGRF